MYEVYAGQRPGRPRLALLISAGLLFAMLALATAVIVHKSRSGQVELGPPRDNPAAGLRYRIPVGWSELNPGQLPDGVMAGAVEPGRGRRLLFFRGQSERTAAATLEGLVSIVEVAQAASKVRVAGDVLTGYDAIDGHGGVTLTLRIGQGEDQGFGVGRAAVTPRGQVFGVVLLADARRTSQTRNLLAQVANELVFPAEPLVADGGPLMAAAGIEFSPPAGARFSGRPQATSSAPAGSPVWPSIHLAAGEGDQRWCLEICVLPLLGKRTIQELAVDTSASILGSVDLDDQIATSPSTQTVQVRVFDEKSVIRLWCWPGGDQRAFMALGRSEPRGVAELEQSVQGIIDSARLTGNRHALDLEPARARAIEVLQQLESGQFASGLAERENRTLVYACRSPGRTVGTLQESAGRAASSRQGESPWLQIRADSERDLPSGSQRESIDTWHLSEDFSAYVMQSKSYADGRLHFEYKESRTRGGPVRCEIVAQDGQRSYTFKPDEAFAPEPVLTHAAAIIARDPQLRPAVFGVTQVFGSGPGWSMVFPAGSLPLPGGQARSLPAVRLVHDISGQTTTVWFDEQDRMAALMFEDDEWWELAGPRGRELSIHARPSRPSKQEDNP